MFLLINTALENREIALVKNKKIIKRIHFKPKSNKTENLLSSEREKNKFIYFSERAQIRQGEYPLLLLIDKLLKRNNLSVKNLRGIFVVKGPGAFTSLRSGITVANTLAYTLRIPVQGIKLDELKDLSNLEFKSLFRNFNFEIPKHHNSRVKRAIIFKKINFVSPFYGKEPNITLK